MFLQCRVTLIFLLINILRKCYILLNTKKSVRAYTSFIIPQRPPDAEYYDLLYYNHVFFISYKEKSITKIISAAKNFKLKFVPTLLENHPNICLSQLCEDIYCLSCSANGTERPLSCKLQYILAKQWMCCWNLNVFQ